MRIIGKYSAEKSKRKVDKEEKVGPDKKHDLYPWLAKDDPRRHQSDEEILYEKIDLSDSALSRKEKARLMKLLIKHRCHDLKEILWVPNFLLYLSNMLSTMGVKELRFCT